MLEQITSAPPANMLGLLWIVVGALAVAVAALWKRLSERNKEISELHRQRSQMETCWRRDIREHAEALAEAARAAEITSNAFQKAIEALRNKPRTPFDGSGK